jgi:hypothetical protein
MQQPSVWPSPGRTKMKSDSLSALVQVIKSGESVASRLAIAARYGQTASEWLAIVVIGPG